MDRHCRDARRHVPVTGAIGEAVYPAESCVGGVRIRPVRIEGQRSGLSRAGGAARDAAPSAVLGRVPGDGAVVQGQRVVEAKDACACARRFFAFVPSHTIHTIMAKKPSEMITGMSMKPSSIEKTSDVAC